MIQASAGLVIIIGSNTAESHPVPLTRIKRADKLRDQKLIAADLRKHEMARRADLHLQPKTGSDLVWLSAVSRYLMTIELPDWRADERALAHKKSRASRGLQVIFCGLAPLPERVIEDRLRLW